jgi:hypothetical protein
MANPYHDCSRIIPPLISNQNININSPKKVNVAKSNLTEGNKKGLTAVKKYPNAEIINKIPSISGMYPDLNTKYPRRPR